MLKFLCKYIILVVWSIIFIESRWVLLRSKKVALGVALGVGVVGLCAGSVYGYSRLRTDYREYIPSYITLEYGEDPVEVLGENLAGAIKFDYKKQDGSKFPKPGMYVGNLGGKNITVSVKDTTAPRIDYPESVWLVSGEGSKDAILAECSITDYSSISSVVNGSVDFSTEGVYSVVVSASDDAGNTVNTGLIRVNIVSDASQIQESSEEKSTTSNDRESVLNDAVGSLYGDVGSSAEAEDANTNSSEAHYDSLVIPSVGIDTDVAIGGDQSSIDANDVCLFPQFNTPGNGSPILLGGHNTKSFSSLNSIAVGDTISLWWEGTEYTYQVEYSSLCTTSGSDLTDTETGENVLEETGREVLQMYTCYGEDDERWVVKAVPVEQ